MLPTAPIRVAFADDYPGILQFLRTLLEADPRVEIVGETYNATDIIAVCQKEHPEVVLLDLHMPGPYTALTVRGILSWVPDAKIIMVTEEDEDVYVRAMARLPICGYVLKGDVVDHLLSAIQAVAAGATWYSPSLEPLLVAL